MLVLFEYVILGVEHIVCWWHEGAFDMGKSFDETVLAIEEAEIRNRPDGILAGVAKYISDAGFENIRLVLMARGIQELKRAAADANEVGTYEDAIADVTALVQEVLNMGHERLRTEQAIMDAERRA